MCWLVWLALTLGADAAGETFTEARTRLEAAHRAAPADEAVLMELAMLCYHEAGYGGNAEIVPVAEKYFGDLLELDPRNARAMVLQGSTRTMYARDTLWPWTRIEHAQRGNARMDEAVALAPDSVEVRWLRALNNFHMPAFMKRRDLVRADLAWLWQTISDQPEDTPVEIRQGIALFHGLMLEKDGHRLRSRNVWNQGLAFDPAGKYADRIKEALER